MAAADNESALAEGSRPFVLIAILFLTFAVLCVGSLFLPQDAYVRYQQLAGTIQFRTIWAYERSHFDKTPLDVVIIGNSRLTSSVSTPTLARDLSARLGYPVRVGNMSFPQEGENAHYVMASQLLKDHPEIKLIIFSAIEQMPREGHPMFKTIAPAMDVVTAPLRGSDYFTDLASLPYRQIALFARSALPTVFGLRTQPDPRLYFGTNFDPTTEQRAPTPPITDMPAHVREVSVQARNRLSAIHAPFLPRAWADVEFGMTRSYVRKSAALARRNGTQVAFLYQPVYSNEGPVQSLDFYTGIGPVFQSRFLASHPELYRDYAHLRPEGAQMQTHWLADQLAAAVRSGQIRLKGK